MEINNLKENIKKILDNKKAVDIEEICVKDKTTITDYFIIASGTSSSQIKSLAENLEYELSKINIKARQVEGDKNNGWILLDFGDIIVHIFLPEIRALYKLSNLWETR
ncbi:MAG: ribosome silencing factor [Oscillospiraceae bacterium]|nr:ribosome silencing factor [Oscillospiraceae bacterium]